MKSETTKWKSTSTSILKLSPICQFSALPRSVGAISCVKNGAKVASFGFG